MMITPCQERREDKICENADVRAWCLEGKIQQEEKKDQYKADQDDQAPEVTDRIAV